MRPGPTQGIQSLPLWPFCCYQTTTYFHNQALLTTHSYMTWQHLLYSFFGLIFKISTATSGVPQSHILANLIINALLDVNADKKLWKSPIIWTVNGWRLFAYRLGRQKSLLTWIPGLLTLKIQGWVPPWVWCLMERSKRLIIFVAVLHEISARYKKV